MQAYHITDKTSPDYYAITMLTNLLTGGESARLNKALVDQQQKAVYVGSFPMQLEDPGLFLAFAVANAGVNIDEVERSMDAEIERVKKEQVSEVEFQKLRNQIENSFIQKNFTVAGRAEQLANYHTFYKDTNLINTELQNFLKVTKDDLARVANQYLTRENRVVLHYLPKSNN